jgi:hypothetical protein
MKSTKKVVLLSVICLIALLVPAVLGAQSNLGAFNLVLEDNFQWGVTYQAFVTSRTLMNNQAVKVGETYTLKVTYTASRDLEDDMMVGFVDSTEAGNWWTQLSWDDSKKIDVAKIPKTKAGETATATITLKIIAAPSGRSGPANGIVFMTEGQGTRGTANSGVKGNVTLRFTEFTLTKN